MLIAKRQGKQLARFNVSIVKIMWEKYWVVEHDLKIKNCHSRNIDEGPRAGA